MSANSMPLCFRYSKDAERDKKPENTRVRYEPLPDGKYNSGTNGDETGGDEGQRPTYYNSFDRCQKYVTPIQSRARQLWRHIFCVTSSQSQFYSMFYLTCKPVRSIFSIML